MARFQVTVEPGGPRIRAMLLAAFEAEGVSVEQAPVEIERRDATGAAGLAIGSLAFLLQAKDSPTVHRAIERAARLPQMRADVEQETEDDDRGQQL